MYHAGRIATPMHMYIPQNSRYVTFRKSKMTTLTDPTETLTVDDFKLNEWFNFYITNIPEALALTHGVKMARIVCDGTDAVTMTVNEMDNMLGS